MTKYQSDATSYNAIVEAMQQIRQNSLAENYSEDEMEEAYMYEEDDEEEMAEMSGEEEEAVAEMMDEALYEMDMEDDEDNLNEADDGSRKARRRKRMRQALLIGAGLAAAGGLGAAYGMGQDPGVGSMAGAEKFAGRPIARALGRTRSGLGMMAGGVADVVKDGAQTVGDKYNDARYAMGRPYRNTKRG